MITAAKIDAPMTASPNLRRLVKSITVLSFFRARQGAGWRSGVAQRHSRGEVGDMVHSTDTLRSGFDPGRVGEPIVEDTNTDQDQNSGCYQNSLQGSVRTHTL
jgi:hypothetical protein